MEIRYHCCKEENRVHLEEYVGMFLRNYALELSREGKSEEEPIVSARLWDENRLFSKIDLIPRRTGQALHYKGGKLVLEANKDIPTITQAQVEIGVLTPYSIREVVAMQGRYMTRLISASQDRLTIDKGEIRYHVIMGSITDSLED